VVAIASLVANGRATSAASAGLGLPRLDGHVSYAA
jgi:hypothetical protein